METLSYCQLMQRCGELEAQLADVVAENAALQFYLRNGPVIRKDGELAAAHQFSPETPATDRFLAEQRAVGVEMFAEKCSQKSKQAISSDTRDSWWLCGEHASDFAAKLRNEVKV